MKHLSSFPEMASAIQIKADETNYHNLKLMGEIEERNNLINVNYLLDFDIFKWSSFLIPIVTDFEIIRFIVKNSQDLKRKMTFKEFVDFSEKFRLLKNCDLLPVNFIEFKEMYSKIKL